MTRRREGSKYHHPDPDPVIEDEVGFEVGIRERKPRTFEGLAMPEVMRPREKIVPE